MHSRRNKRWTWGSGRGARLLNLKSFAGAVVLAVASVASSVFAQTVSIDMRTINNAGNANSAAGMGGVNYIYQMGTTEVTNAQYAAFLNRVGQTNPNNIYNTAQAANALYGITQSGASPNFTYAVKSGMGSLPVSFTSWFSAARFINWLQNGQQSNPASLETGTYALNNATSGNPVARNPLATFVLPSLNEWYKGAFHTGGLASTAYTTYGTNSNTQPTASVSNLTLANSANFNSVGTQSVAVGSYTNSASAYGLFDMMGNVIEMTDTVNTANTAQYRAMGGAWSTTSANLLAQYSSSPTSVVGLTTATASNSLGFRVAAVPEPSTYALLATAIGGLGGFRALKRRRGAA